MKLKSTLLLITLSFLFACTPAENTDTSIPVTELPVTEAPTKIEAAPSTKPTFENTRWTSTDDPKSVIEIKDKKWSNIYDGKTLDSGDYEVEDKQVTVTLGDEVYEYFIIKHTDTELEMSMIGGRGNTLSYTKE
ncbi:MAG: hypothetical protein ACI94Y_002054 [Maribacter sp.]|jgi:hypothetical protein